jgi:cyclopropane-fatty-acyl-phospholipid synthase
LTLILPDNDSLEFGCPKSGGPHACLRLHSFKPLTSLFLKGELAFAESYIQGEWESPDMTALFQFGLAIEENFLTKKTNEWLINAIERVRHLLNRNSRRGSQRNISYHYDLGNRFYELWLDRSMTYSSALFKLPNDSLEQGQQNKYQAIADMLGIKKSDQVLEIGCGWGGFSEFVARDIGAEIHGLTLSQEQLSFANKRYQKAGLDHLATAAYTDYRDSNGQFDKIVSIEMFEAVGEENWDTYFQSVQERLAPGGVAVLQIITIDDHRFHSYRKGADFIQRYIFPGGFLPSQSALVNAIKRNGFDLTRSEFFGQSYARTCAIWNKQFQHAWPEIQSMGYSLNFKRMWEYYLSYCEAGFQEGCVDVGIFKIKKST